LRISSVAEIGDEYERLDRGLPFRQRGLRFAAAPVFGTSSLA
jgi:hypothetical protein